MGRGRTFTGRGRTFTGRGRTFTGRGRTFTGRGRTFTGRGRTFTGRGSIHSDISWGWTSASSLQDKIYISNIIKVHYTLHVSSLNYCFNV